MRELFQLCLKCGSHIHEVKGCSVLVIMCSNEAKYSSKFHFEQQVLVRVHFKLALSKSIAHQDGSYLN